MPFQDFIDDLLRALSFLSRIPVPGRVFEGHDGKLSRTVRAFPLAGFLIALLPALVLILAASAGKPLIGAILAIGLEIALTGALHEDGLADCADGLFGHADRARALDIMKDSRIGAYGTIAIVLGLLLRISAVALIAAEYTPFHAGLAFLAGAVIARLSMVAHWHRLPDARANGVAQASGRPGDDAMIVAAIIGLWLILILAIWSAGPVDALAAMLMALAVLLVFTARIRARLGGQTGDTIGAAGRLSELTFVTLLALLA